MAENPFQSPVETELQDRPSAKRLPQTFSPGSHLGLTLLGTVCLAFGLMMVASTLASAGVPVLRPTGATGEQIASRLSDPHMIVCMASGLVMAGSGLWIVVWHARRFLSAVLAPKPSSKGRTGRNPRMAP